VVAASRDQGELCIFLHSQMPYVEGFETWPFGEEWLLEAMGACYVPLAGMLERLAERGARQVATVGITPVLADQLELAEVGRRFVGFMRGVRRECHQLDSKGLEQVGETAAAAALRAGYRDYERAADEFESGGGDLLGAFAGLRDAGVIDLWTSAATHAVLPMIATRQATLLQLETGVNSHRARFGGWSGGLWLPECAYQPGLAEPLGACGVRAFCVDQTARIRAGGDPLDQLEPVATEAGPVAVPIDWGTVDLVWSEHGYPGDGAYRDYHRQTLNGMRAWANAGGPYDPAAARARAQDHARQFVAAVAARLGVYRAARGRPGLVVFAVDTELLGHWWYEGLWWLERVVEEAQAQGVALATLPEAIERHPPRERELLSSTWGDGKDLHTWDSRHVAGITWTQRGAELRLVSELSQGPLPDQVHPAALRAARELLALQSSDWAFMVTRRLAGEYPDRRVRAHAAAFERAISALARSVRDFRAMPSHSPEVQRAERAVDVPDGRLRGLAPGLSLSPLLGPGTAWAPRPRKLSR
jgi:1,4-alpha-glucan branching enzyme